MNNNSKKYVGIEVYAYEDDRQPSLHANAEDRHFEFNIRPVRHDLPSYATEQEIQLRVTLYPEWQSTIRIGVPTDYCANIDSLEKALSTLKRFTAYLRSLPVYPATIEDTAHAARHYYSGRDGKFLTSRGEVCDAWRKLAREVDHHLELRRAEATIKDHANAEKEVSAA